MQRPLSMIIIIIIIIIIKIIIIIIIMLLLYDGYLTMFVLMSVFVSSTLSLHYLHC